MAQVLSNTHTHAEDVGGQIVEVGQPIPDGADDDVVARLEEEGALGDEQAPEPEPEQASTRKRGS